MKNWIRVSVLTLLLFAATILPGITAALTLSPWMYVLSVVLFLVCNIFPTVEKNLSRKLRIAAGGANLLMAFLALLVLDCVFVILTGVLWFGMFSAMFWNNVIVVYIIELLVFWNGIIRIYCTSAMIGTRWRIVGILCGMIPIANIIVLVKLISLARSEINMEKRRTIRNRERKDKAVCATKYPIRMLLSIIKDENLIKNYIRHFKYGEIEIENIFKQLDAGINVGVTTSTGRVLDSVSAALEICNERTYEGEASMKLESAAYYSTNNLELPLIIEDNVLNTTEILKEVVSLYSKGYKKADIASAAQKTIAEGLSELAIRSADKKGLEDIGATGGVFYNEAITDTVKKCVESNEYNFLQHKNTCCGDGSVSLGQTIVAKIRNI